MNRDSQTSAIATVTEMEQQKSKFSGEPAEPNGAGARAATERREPWPSRKQAALTDEVD
jgi:hypothetical protein